MRVQDGLSFDFADSDAFTFLGLSCLAWELRARGRNDPSLTHERNCALYVCLSAALPAPGLNCSNATTCASCVVTPGCGWCAGTSSGVCLPDSAAANVRERYCPSVAMTWRGTECPAGLFTALWLTEVPIPEAAFHALLHTSIPSPPVSPSSLRL